MKSSISFILYQVKNHVVHVGKV